MRKKDDWGEKEAGGGLGLAMRRVGRYCCGHGYHTQRGRNARASPEHSQGLVPVCRRGAPDRMDRVRGGCAPFHSGGSGGEAPVRAHRLGAGRDLPLPRGPNPLAAREDDTEHRRLAGEERGLFHPDDHAPDRRETGNPPRRHFVPEPALEGPRGGVCFRPPRPPALARTPSRRLGRRRHRGRGRERTSGCGAGGRRTPPRTGIDRHHLPPRGARRGAAHHRRHHDGGAHPDPHTGRVRPRAWRVFRI